MATVTFCIPHGGQVPPEFYRHLWIMSFTGASKKHTFTFAEIDMMLVGKARNELIVCARNAKADVAFFVDDDVLLPDNAGELVDQAMQLGVVSGLYISRRFPYFPQVYTKASGPEFENAAHQLYWPEVDYLSGVSQVDAVGTGCLAIRMDIFAELEKHRDAQAQADREAAELIRGVVDPDNAAILAAIETITRKRTVLSPWFEFLDGKGEDLYFCERLAEIGQPVWLNADVKCKHLGYVPIEEAHFKQLKDSGAIKRVGT